MKLKLRENKDRMFEKLCILNNYINKLSTEFLAVDIRFCIFTLINQRKF